MNSKTNNVLFLKFSLCILLFIATAQGNQCTAAIEITAPSTQVGTITNEELVPLPNCIDSVTSPIITNQRAMFYRVRVGRGVAISVDSCGSCFDTIISVFADTNCNDNLHCMISNDDVGDARFCTEPNTCDPLYGRAQFLSNIPLSCTRDESYLIAITGYGSSTGNYQLNFKTYGSCVTPVNDECFAAITLSVPSFTPFKICFRVTSMSNHSLSSTNHFIKKRFLSLYSTTEYRWIACCISHIEWCKG